MGYDCNLHQPVNKLQFSAEDVIGIDRLHGDLFDGQSHKSETMLPPEYNIACKQSLISLQKNLIKKLEVNLIGG